MMLDRIIRAVSIFVPLRVAKKVTEFDFTCPFCSRVSPRLTHPTKAHCYFCFTESWLERPWWLIGG